MPTPSVPSGPGSIHAPSRLTGMIFAAVATMSPPSPITIGSSSVSSQSRTSRHMRCGSTGTSSLSSAASTFASAAVSILRSSSRQPREVEPRAAVLHLLEQQLEGAGEVADQADVGLAVLADQRRVHVELDDLRVGRDRLAEAPCGSRAACRPAGCSRSASAPRAASGSGTPASRAGRAAAHAVRVARDVRLGDEAVHRRRRPATTSRRCRPSASGAARCAAGRAPRAPPRDPARAAAARCGCAG